MNSDSSILVSVLMIAAGLNVLASIANFVFRGGGRAARLYLMYATCSAISVLIFSAVTREQSRSEVQFLAGVLLFLLLVFWLDGRAGGQS